MDDDSNRSSEATQFEEISTPEETNHQDARDSAPVPVKLDHQTNVTPPTSPEEDFTTCPSITLDASGSDICVGLPKVPVKYEMRPDELERLKNQLQGSHQEALATVIAQAAQAHSKSQIKLHGVVSSTTELSNMPATAILHLPSVPVLSNLQCSNSHGPEADQKDTMDVRTLSVPHTVKLHTDDYNWRKYGQKQVKSPEGSRSYYKCTHTECDAKKIESCDQFSSVTGVVYKGHHEHDPPKKVYSKERKISSPPKSLKRKSISTPGLNEHQSCQSVGCVPIQVKQQIAEAQEKQRIQKNCTPSLGSVLKHPKKPNFVVHAAGDVEISADGYRWRKYGQKMVKGNPHPRNYYKCTSAGCPVKKQIEKAIDGTSKVMITYNGVHDHDMPVPKKRQGPPSSLLMTVASSVSKKVLQTQSTTQVSRNEAVKANDCARTLLSVGIEIKQC